jgi:hypothetical protein
MPKIGEWRVAVFHIGSGLLDSEHASIRCRSGGGGRLDTDEENIPMDVFPGRSGTAAWKSLVQHLQVGDFVNLRQKPVGKRTAAGAGNLPAQQLDRAVEYPVVVRFCNAFLAMIDKPNHARVFDGCPEHRMGLERHPNFTLTQQTQKIAGTYFSEK